MTIHFIKQAFQAIIVGIVLGMGGAGLVAGISLLVLCFPAV